MEKTDKTDERKDFQEPDEVHEYGTQGSLVPAEYPPKVLGGRRNSWKTLGKVFKRGLEREIGQEIEERVGIQNSN
ncbi:hypothetical protein MASR2M41_18560 [Flammeovirgaceae bacterium]